MHYGTFEAQSPETTHTPRHASFPVETNHDRAPISRRRWSAGLVGIVAGAGIGGIASRFLASGAHAAESTGAATNRVEQSPGDRRPTEASAAERGTLNWAIGMLHAPEDELFQAAGDLERVSLRYVAEARLEPVFARLLDIALTSSHELADIAAQCAARSLARGGHAARVRLRRGSIVGNRRFPGTAAIIERPDFGR